MKGTCPHCGSDNPAGRKVCGDCGAGLQGVGAFGAEGLPDPEPVARLAAEIGC
jgi:hypothetical protein